MRSEKEVRKRGNPVNREKTHPENKYATVSVSN